MTIIEASDGKDYLYTKHGHSWRARVRINSEIPTDAPTNGDKTVESAGVGLAVSVALLDDKGDVATDPQGRYRVFPAHVVTLIPESFTKVNPEEVIEETIQKQIDEAYSQLEGKNKLYEALARFQ